MLRLLSPLFPSHLQTLGLGLSIVSLTAIGGCSPKNSATNAAKNPEASTSQPSSQATTYHSDSSASRSHTIHEASPQPTEADKNSNASITLQTPRPAQGQGKILVDDDGYVILENSSSGQDSQSATTTDQTENNASLSSLSPDEESARGTAASTVSTVLPLELSASTSEADAVNKNNDTTAESSNAAGAALTLSADSSDRAAPPAETDKHDPESGLASFDEKHQKIADGWPKPQAVLFLTGQQNGYIEPCGCTGLENQKGGLNRRDTLLKQLRQRGWDVVPMDVGNFERRAGRQAEIKFQTTVEALKDMGYRAATLGIDDLKLSSTHLLSLTATEGKTETPFISANTYILVEEYMPKSKIVEVGGRKIGITAVLGDSYRSALSGNSDVITTDTATSLKPVVAELKKAGCDYLVLLAHATFKESQQLAVEVPGFDLVATSGDFPEPFYQLEEIEGSSAQIAQVGAKGMYTVLIGLYPDSDQPVRYQRVALSSQFPDSPRMLERFASYQKQLESLGFDGLGLRASTPPEGRKYVGSETCGNCHTKAYEVWKASEHFTATESLVNPPNDRSMIPRHFDPECLSCHVTGWNAKSYFPYASGYTSLEHTPMLTGSGCENCHGPGSKHVAAENGEVDADDELLAQLRAQMRLPLAEAKNRCLDCHDQDNSPEFQHEGAFEAYWEQIAHPGKD